MTQRQKLTWVQFSLVHVLQADWKTVRWWTSLCTETGRRLQSYSTNIKHDALLLATVSCQNNRPAGWTCPTSVETETASCKTATDPFFCCNLLQIYCWVPVTWEHCLSVQYRHILCLQGDLRLFRLKKSLQMLHVIGLGVLQYFFSIVVWCVNGIYTLCKNLNQALLHQWKRFPSIK